MKPSVDLNLTYLDRSGVTETGNGASDLVIQGGGNTFLSIMPALEVGMEHRLASNLTMRGYAKAIAAFYADGAHSLKAGFADATASVSSFSISAEMDDIYADMEAG